VQRVLNPAARRADDSRELLSSRGAPSVEHVVFYTGLDGLPAFRRVESLNEAVSLIEYLRNAKNVNDTSVFALHAVPLEFRPYYRVDVPADAYEAVEEQLEGVVIEVADETDASAPHIALVPDLALETPAVAEPSTHDIPRLATEVTFDGIDRHPPVETPEGMVVPALAGDDEERLAAVVQLHPLADVPGADADAVAEIPETVVDDSDHLGALAELAAQVAEESSADAVDEEPVELRTEPELFAPEADVPAHVDVTVLELEVAEAEPDVAETDEAAAVAGDDTEHVPVEVLVMSDETISHLLAEQLPDAEASSVAEPVAESAIAPASEAVEPIALEPIAVDTIAVEPIGVDTIAVEPIAVEPIATDPIAVAGEPIAEPAAVVPVATPEPVAVAPVATPEPAPGVPGDHPEPAAAAGHSPIAVALDVPPLTEEELASVPDVPALPAARTVSPETGGRREGARTLGFFAR
jgi:nicotinate-nucleotide--dimethylbenzimidazole phosphoribosyltransferase